MRGVLISTTPLAVLLTDQWEIAMSRAVLLSDIEAVTWLVRAYNDLAAKAEGRN